MRFNDDRDSGLLFGATLNIDYIVLLYISVPLSYKQYVLCELT